jgi:hypothetical protein
MELEEKEYKVYSKFLDKLHLLSKYLEFKNYDDYSICVCKYIYPEKIIIEDKFFTKRKIVFIDTEKEKDPLTYYLKNYKKSIGGIKYLKKISFKYINDKIERAEFFITEINHYCGFNTYHVIEECKNNTWRVKNWHMDGAY